MKNTGVPASDRYPVSSGTASEEQSAFGTNIVAQVARSVKGQIVKTAPEFEQEMADFGVQETMKAVSCRRED